MENLITMPSIGNQLGKKREEQGLTIHYVARQLRLREELIQNLEDDNYNNIPTPYLKGYIRSYAKLLSCSDWENLIMVENRNDTQSLQNLKKFKIKKQVSAGDKYIQWITYSIVSILIVLVVLWWRSDILLYKNFASNELMPDQLYRMAQNNVIKVDGRGE
jgi:cytoskeleton protein RodZ